MKTPGESKHHPEVSPVVQRVLGAAVLVAIALIAIPALFDFSRRQSPGIEEGLVPPRPEHLRVEVLPLPADKPPVVPRQQIDAELKDLVPGPAMPPATLPAPAETRSTGKTARAAGPTGQGAAAGHAEKKHRPKSLPKRSSESDNRTRPTLASGWAVQLGSFGRKANAQRLLTRLEKAGFPALLQASTGSGKPLIRVLAGPVANRAEARALKRRLKARLAVDGLIVAYRARGG